MKNLRANSSATIDELKLNPIAVLQASGDMPVAILNGSKQIGYVLTVAAWEKIYSILDEHEILKTVQARMRDGKKPVKIKINGLHPGATGDEENWMYQK